MCDVLLPALAAVAVLGMLNSGNSAGHCIEIPQQVGNVTHSNYYVAQTHYQPHSAPEFAYAAPQAHYQEHHQQSYAAPAYAPAPAPQAYYGAPETNVYGGHYSYADQGGVGAGINYDGQQMLGAGVHANDGGVGVGANVGGVGAGVDFGPRTY